MVPADSNGISRVPPYSGARSSKLTSFRLRGYHPLWPALSMTVHLTVKFLTCRRGGSLLQPRPTTPYAQRLPAWHAQGLGCFPFARRYSGNHYCFLFLWVLRCFSSPRSLPPDKSGECCRFTTTGCPIRKSPDQRLFAPPRSLSQLITSFIGYPCQGILRTPLLS